MDRLTMAVAAGSGIAFGGAPALDAWKAARGSSPSGGRDIAQRRSILRLASRFPQAVKGI